MNYQLPVYAVFAFLLVHVNGFAQAIPAGPSTPAISLSGRSRVTGVSASPLPESSGLPERYLRWEFEPSVALYGVPVSAHMLLTTENDPTRRAMNSVQVIFDVKAFQKMLRERVMAKAKSIETDFRAKAEEMQAKLRDPATVADLVRFDELQNLEKAGGLTDSARDELEELRVRTEEARKMGATAERYAKMDPEAMAKEKERELKTLQREIADPAKLEAKVKELDLLSGAEKFLLGFQDMGLGVTYPRYSPLVLTGVPVNGASLEYSYGILNVAAAGGSMNGPIPDGRIAPETFDRSLVAGKLGLGASGGTHFHLLGLYAREDENSAGADSAYTPAENYVFAADGRLDLFGRSVTFGGVVAGSMMTRDVTSPEMEIEEKDDPTGLGVVNSLGPTASSFVDYAWSLETSFNLFRGATRGKIAARMVRPGYATLGVPYLRTDVFGQEAELEQRLFGGGVIVGGYYKRNEDNILPWKLTRVGAEWLPVRTTLTSYGGRLGLQFRNLPYLRVEYAPYLQQTDIEGEGSGADNRTTLISATAGHSYHALGLTGSTTGTALVQTGTSHDGLYEFTNNVYMLSQSVAFAFPLSLTVGGSYTETELADTLRRLAAITGSGSFNISSALKCSFGLTYSDRNDGGSRIGFTLRSIIKLWNYGELDLRAQRNAYESGISADEDYEQLTFRGMLTTRW